MKALKICLWLTGIVCLLSVIGVIAPLKHIQWFMGLFGIESLPDSPLFLYMLRLICATWAGIGIFFIILALNPLSYGVLVPLSALFLILVGAVCGVTGFITKMPFKWYASDLLSCVILGLLILIFYPQAKKNGDFV
ncbi:MAG: hypothetical protein KAS69_03710 [Planctomycetes bacterium]|nr:hypothetical protein [Planctomycetota bacterium]